jgi:uncharacterized membrane protein YgaE (UPF0421/DUF939 family)
MEKNKTGKYLKYAIGEIILVVIGILIALSINNWNTKQQEIRELHGYLNSIKKNIQEDLGRVGSMKDRRESSILNSRAYLDIVDKNEIAFEDY